MGLTAAAINLTAFIILLLVEFCVSQLGWIPPQQENFLYLMDRNLFRIGDMVGLTIVAFAVGGVLDRTGFPSKRYIIAAAIFAVLLTAGLHWVWIWQPHPDSAYPVPGQVSWLGYAHLPYFAGQVVWVLLGLRSSLDLKDPKVRRFVLLGLLGGGIWLATVIGTVLSS